MNGSTEHPKEPPFGSWFVHTYKGQDEYGMKLLNGMLQLGSFIKWSELGGRFPHALDPVKYDLPDAQKLPLVVYRCVTVKGVLIVRKEERVPLAVVAVYGIADLREEWKNHCYKLWLFSHVRRLPLAKWDDYCQEHPTDYHCAAWLAWDKRYGNQPMPAIEKNE